MSGQPSTSLMFVAYSGPAASDDRRRSRIIRSHAVGVALARQRRRAQRKGENFREFTNRGVRTANAAATEGGSPSGYLGMASADPFETLPINARRLTTLFHSKGSISAGEPVFSINEAIHYQSLHSVFGTGLTDGALTPALGLIMRYATNGWIFDSECNKLSSVALQQIQKKLSSPGTAASPATIGSVLLLLGVEYRLGARQRAQAHLQGIRALLQLCTEQKVTLPVPLRRAIYWQDLFSSILVQTDRIVHNDFHPGTQCPRLDLSPMGYVPEGFARRASRLGRRFICLVSDVAALYRCRPDWLESNRHEQDLPKLCNTQAYLEGQLHELRQSTSDDLLIACIIAAFLCVYAFWTSVWNAALIPRGLSTQLLHHVRCWQHGIEPQHDEHLLFWLVHIGKAFAIDAHIRHGFSGLQENGQIVAVDLPASDEETKQILHSFIWSDHFYQPEGGWFWQQINC